MEQTQKTPFFKYIAESLLVFAIVFVLLILCLAFPPLIVVLTVPIIFINVRRGFAYGLIPVVLLIALAWFVTGTTGTVVFIAMFVPVAYIISYAIQSKIRSFEAVVLSVGACAVGLGLACAYFYFVLNTDIISYILKLAENFMHAYPGTAHQLLLAADLQDVLTGATNINAVLSMPEAEAIKSTMTSIKAFLDSTFPTFLSEYAILGGFLSYVISRAFLKKKGVTVASIPAFSRFRLPKGFFWGILITAVFLAGGSLMNLQNFNAVFEACYAAYLIVFTISGLSFLDFLIVRRNMGKGGRIAILIISGLLVSYILAWVGVFDTLFKIKERIERPDEFDGE